MRPYFVIRLIPFVLLSCILPKSSVGAEQLPFQRLQSGIEWFEGTVQANKESFTLRLVHADISQYSLEIVAEDPIVSGHTVLEYQKLTKAHVALSGGFLKSYYPPLPLGLVKSNGKILNRPSHDPFFSGLFCSREGELTIERYTGKEQTTPWDHCLQSGPLLVYEGRSALEVGHYPHEFVYKAFNRAFVAIDQQGRALLGVTGKVTLPSLISLLQRPAEHGGLGCRAALNLSGVSVGMVVEVTGRFLTAGDIEVYPPNAIILKSGEQKSFTNSIGMKFVLIQAGTFMMGSPRDEPKREKDEKQHRVTISKPFYLQTTEVTQGQWNEVMGNNPSRFKNCGDDCPVESVSWKDVQKFIERLNQMEGTNKYRLPTEAEWEYACRAGTTTPFYTGNCISTNQTNYDGRYPMPGCPKGKYRKKTVSGGSFQPNPWGLYDMHGNVWEWCQDWYGDYRTGDVSDPNGPSSGGARVLRGGSCFNSARNIRSAYRFRYSPESRFNSMGFRVARSF